MKVNCYFIILLFLILFSQSCSESRNPSYDPSINVDELGTDFASVMNTIQNSPVFADNKQRDFSGLNFRVGAYFWYGFSYDGPHLTDRLYREFADRQPVWGWIDASLENMEQQIEYAVAGGLTYFAFDWYYNAAPNMNRAVDTFLKTGNSNKMQFCLLVANHEGAYIPYDKWEDACNQWIPYLTNKQALKVDGKPVIFFFSAYHLADKLGGTEKTKECIDYLDSRVKEAGFPGVMVIGCENPYGSGLERTIDYNPEAFNETEWIALLKERKLQGLSGLSGYNYRKYSPVTTASGTTTYRLPYKEMTSQHEKCWEAFSEYQSIPYVPVILGGWDCRPWETTTYSGGNRSCYAPDRTPRQLYDHILNAAEWMKKNPNSSLDNIAIIYAFNEYCEGGYIAPTLGDRGLLLNAVRQATQKINQ
ncbi:MAG: glycoside hydrolase family 99-like domain-containing protein [Mangrovibacterium sp.]